MRRKPKKNGRDVEKVNPEGKIFFEYLRIKRQEYGISMAKLCEGLCGIRMIAYMEKGERYPNLLLRDRLSARLGIGCDNYAQLLDYREYDRWFARQTVIHNLFRDCISDATEALNNYEKRKHADDLLEEQFCLAMRFQIRRRENASFEELAELSRKAADLTLKNVTQENLTEKVLSAQEIHLLLEKEWYRLEGRRSQFFETVVKWLNRCRFEEEVRIKVYPKAVLYMCRCRIEKPAETKELLEILKICNQVLNVLRDGGMLYYFWEFLELREKLLLELSEDFPRFERLQEENRRWKETLEGLYVEYGIERRTFHEGFLYVSKCTECVNDVIRIRRKMLGFSQQKLCEGICDVKTLRRLEHRQTIPHRTVLTELLIRLGLPGELRYSYILTEHPQNTEFLRKMRNAKLLYHVQDARKWWEKSKAEIEGMSLTNRQFLLGEEIVFSWMNGEISREEYCCRLREVVELTFSLTALLQPGEKYLTINEMDYIRYRMQGLEPDGEEFRTELQRFEELFVPYMSNGKIETIIGSFEFIMSYVGSELGNREEFGRADDYSRYLAEEILRERRISFLPGAVYDQWWNCKERKKRGLPVETERNTEIELSRCIVLSEIWKNARKERFYRKVYLANQEKQTD